MLRDRGLFGDAAAVHRRTEQRYLPGQALYLRTASPVQTADVVLDSSQPVQTADVVLDSSHWRNPVVLKWPHSP